MCRVLPAGLGRWHVPRGCSALWARTLRDTRTEACGAFLACFVHCVHGAAEHGAGASGRAVVGGSRHSMRHCHGMLNHPRSWEVVLGWLATVPTCCGAGVTTCRKLCHDFTFVSFLLVKIPLRCWSTSSFCWRHLNVKSKIFIDGFCMFQNVHSESYSVW